MKRGLAVIAARSDSLSRFTTAYARLAKLPAPRLDTVHVSGAGPPRRRRRNALAGSHRTTGPDLSHSRRPRSARAAADQPGAQRRRRRAADRRRRDASAGSARADGFELWIDDEGAGLPNASNLFVPFFTTKPGGSGIGLVLSRQIAEAHGGIADAREPRRPPRLPRVSAPAVCTTDQSPSLVLKARLVTS